MYLYTQVHVKVKSLHEDVFLSCFPHYILSQGLSINLAILGRLTSPQNLSVSAHRAGITYALSPTMLLYGS